MSHPSTSIRRGSIPEKGLELANKQPVLRAARVRRGRILGEESEQRHAIRECLCKPSP